MQKGAYHESFLYTLSKKAVNTTGTGATEATPDPTDLGSRDRTFSDPPII